MRRPARGRALGADKALDPDLEFDFWVHVIGLAEVMRQFAPTALDALQCLQFRAAAIANAIGWAARAPGRDQTHDAGR